ncbi:hypothetical protein GCM10010112_92910 [Actinoplanes lobatus]|uniref:Uncharacterized protein n=1 Tax=Actinoplanes lobatus TaxID=113568 RepID=A0A7W7HR03_9ACTN|nr:hypothetical protein [Actinoplanes lobatus]MBB4755123.1 hypothetical protein [Actinoplanes lobatus]GGN99256.1 hypothetical protein GCM10010112_92910 [Actinoplanes lobatus]GIE40562.1 hypothetical protein Alo02nite_34600 [Actinoplanes lobatus]
MTDLVNDSTAVVGEQWPTPDAVMKTPAGSDDFDTQRMGELEGLLESVDPTVTGWILDLAEAAILRFGEAGEGPDDQALAWLRYAQRATTVLACPLSERSCAANTELGRLCLHLGRVREAAAAWEVAVLGAEQRQQRDLANWARLYWAQCLHSLGSCGDAVAVLRRAGGGQHGDVVVAQILCLRLLGRCGRQDDAAALWSAMEMSTTPTLRRQALNDLRSPANRVLNKADARTHEMVCAYRRRVTKGASQQVPRFEVGHG